MGWNITDSGPIWMQLNEQLMQRISAGVYPKGSKLPTVRELASEAGVNPNTMQRAMMEMEREGLVFSQRTAGRFVTEDAARIKDLRETLARDQVKEFLESMYLLGFRQEEIVSFVEKEGEHHEHSGV